MHASLSFLYNIAKLCHSIHCMVDHSPFRNLVSKGVVPNLVCFVSNKREKTQKLHEVEYQQPNYGSK